MGRGLSVKGIECVAYAFKFVTDSACFCAASERPGSIRTPCIDRMIKSSRMR
jgi:hypothetical protein